MFTVVTDQDSAVINVQAVEDAGYSLHKNATQKHDNACVAGRTCVAGHAREGGQRTKIGDD